MHEGVTSEFKTFLAQAIVGMVLVFTEMGKPRGKPSREQGKDDKFIFGNVEMKLNLRYLMKEHVQ